MNAFVLVILSLGAFYLAQRFYARWLERRVYDMDTDEPTPAHTLSDGVDYVVCNKHVLFGHHFCSIAGAAPIVGPAIAVIWGWVPALLWVVFGTMLIGAVHDFGALSLSAKRGGSTIGDLAGQILGSRARVFFLLVLILLTWIIIAVFAFIIAKLFSHERYSAAVIPVNFEILVAVLIGWWIYRRKAKLLVPSLIAVTLLYVVVFLCAPYPEWGQLPEWLCLYGKPEVTWIVFLLVYAYVASVLPVWTLLQPRDFINSHQLFIGLAGLILGIAILQPVVTAPAFNTAIDASAVPIIPFLFITVACGAISGFHGLVSSGTTSKQLDRMRDARTIGYGGMLGEGTLAMIAVIAVTAGLGSAEQWHQAYDRPWTEVVGDSLGNFVTGASSFLGPLLGGNVQLAGTVVAVIVISFAATTLDTAARIQRFCLAELGRTFDLRALGNRYVAAAVAVVPAGLLAIFTQAPGKGPGSGGYILWPLFGTTNQLIGALTLMLITVHLKKTGRPVWPTLLPMVFLVVMTTTAGVMELSKRVGEGNWLVVAFGAFFLLLEALMFVEAVKALRRKDPLQVRHE